MKIQASLFCRFAACLLFAGLYAQAQELLLPLKYNAAERPGLQDKGFRRNFDKACDGGLIYNAFVSEGLQPSACLEEDGAVTVVIENGVAPYSFQLSSPLGISLGSGAVTTPQYTFGSLPSGPYFITASDNNGNSLQIRYELDDIDIPPIKRQNWEATKRNAFCNTLGSLRKIFDTDVSINYRLYNSSGTLVHNYATQSALAANLQPGVYYLRSNREGEKCYAYYILDIIEEPTISLPFTEDFSTSWIYPDRNVWIDDLALVNDTYAQNPLSIGVVTLDGLNQYGQPYAPVPSGNDLIDGIGDVLTSRPMCLDDAGLQLGDTLFLSFFYQPEGFGDFPNPGDSLVMEAYIPRVRDSIYYVTNYIDGYHIKYDDDAFNTGANVDINIAVPAGDMISFDEDTYVFYIDNSGNSIYLDFTNPNATLTYVNDTIIPIIEEFTVAVKDTTWVPQWSIDGLSASLTPDFEPIVVKIADTSSFYNGFRFRFRNRATISGNNDHWNIDYIQANTQLPSLYPLLQDVAFIEPAPAMLTRYQSMPWSHFYPYIDAELAQAGNVPLKVRNNDSGPANRTLIHTINDVCSGTEIYQYNAGTADVLGSIEGIETTDVVFIKDDIANALLSNSSIFSGKDTVILENIWQLNVSLGSTELNYNNDTIYQYQQFANYFAYDDGSAEKAYGLYGTGAQLAYQFMFNHPDTLRALQINFVNMNANVSNHEFTIKVWRHINVDTETGLPSTSPIPDELLYEEETVNMPRYLNQINGFWTYTLSQPLPIEDDTIYVGIEQRFEDLLNIGFDRNHNASGKLFYNTGGQWLGSIYDGALMLRPVVGSALPDGNLNVGIEEPATDSPAQTLTLYPNPADDQLQLRFNNPTTDNYNCMAQVYDFSGRLVIAETLANNSIGVAHLPSGIYLVRLVTLNGEQIAVAKFVKQ